MSELENGFHPIRFLSAKQEEAFGIWPDLILLRQDGYHYCQSELDSVFA